MDEDKHTKAKRTFTKIPPCEYCGRLLRFAGKLEKHRAKHVKEIGTQDAINKLEDSGEAKVHTCLRCKLKFLDVKELYSHRDYLCRCSLDTVRTWECESCNKKFDNEKGLSVHTGSCRSFTADRDLPVIRCDECGKTCVNDHQLRLHKRTHDLGFVCMECKKVFKSQTSLNRHMPLHTGTQRFQCKECPKKYTTRAALLTHHQTSHVLNGEKPFQCATCGKCYATAHVLKRHQNVHMDVSAQCNHCGRKYKQARYLARHKCIKTPEFLCHNCGNAFKLEQTLLKHHATCPAIVKKSEEEQDRDEDEVEETAREQDEHYSSPDEQATAIFDLLVQAAGINDEVTITNTTADDGSVSETVTVILEDRSPSSVEEMSVKTSAMAEVVGNSGAVSDTVTFIMENVVDDSASETVSAVRDGHGPDEEEDAHLTPSAVPALNTDTQRENIAWHTDSGGKTAAAADNSEPSEISAAATDMYSCVECPETFADVDELYLQHLQTHRKQQCDKCYKDCVDKFSLEEHLAIECQMNLQGVMMAVINSSSMEKQTCADCGQKFANSELLERHQAMSEKKSTSHGNEFRCLYCPKHYAKYCQFVAHMKSYRYSCKGCYVHYKTVTPFVAHVRQAHRTGHVCDHCKRQFASATKLKDHIRDNAKLMDIIDLKCLQCGMQFPDSRGLEQHGDANYTVCNHCSVHFPTSNRLNAHLKYEHDGISEDDMENTIAVNLCRHCDVNFPTRAAFRAHMVDTGVIACKWERDALMCLRCGALFDAKWKLMRHLKLWKYHCRECQRHFRRERQWWKHTHSGIHIQDGGKMVEEDDKGIQMDEEKRDGINPVSSNKDNFEDSEQVEPRMVVSIRKRARKKCQIRLRCTNQDDDKKMKERLGKDGGVKRKKLDKSAEQRKKQGKLGKNKKVKSDQMTSEVNGTNVAMVTDNTNGVEKDTPPNTSASELHKTRDDDQQLKRDQEMCQYCGLWCGKKRQLRKHIKAWHDNSIRPGKNQCNFCQQVFPRPGDVAYHMYKSKKDLGALNGGTLKCDYCPLVMSYRCQVKAHAMICGNARKSSGSRLDEDKDTSRSSGEKGDEAGPVPISVGIAAEEANDSDKDHHQELIELNPDVFYKVRFPPGMIAKLVSAEGKQHLCSIRETSGSDTDDAREGRASAIPSHVIPVISLESICSIADMEK